MVGYGLNCSREVSGSAEFLKLPELCEFYFYTRFPFHTTDFFPGRTLVVEYVVGSAKPAEMGSTTLYTEYTSVYV